MVGLESSNNRGVYIPVLQGAQTSYWEATVMGTLAFQLELTSRHGCLVGVRNGNGLWLLLGQQARSITEGLALICAID